MAAPSFPELKKGCEECVTHFKKELSKMRSGRASQALIEDLHVNYYGSTVPLKSLGMINAPEPRMLTVQAYDRGSVEAIEKAIQSADLGLNPSHDGSLIRILIPTLTEERRKDLVRGLHKHAEETRVSIRNQRHKAIDTLKKKQKAKEISEDDLRRGQEEIQKSTDHYIAEVDKLLAGKEKEMMEV